MKALKNESPLYMEQIVSAITSCCESTDKPSNRSLMELYTLVGRCICRQGEKAFVAHLAEMISTRFPSLNGFSLRNLRRMRDFYRTYENNPALMEKAKALGWTQNAVILECCESDEQRSFYILLAAGQNLSKLALMKAIQENAFATASDKESPMENTEPSFAPVSDYPVHASVDTSLAIETACEPFVPACEPLRQGDTLPQRTDKGYAADTAENPNGQGDAPSPPFGRIKPQQEDSIPIAAWADRLKPPWKPLCGILQSHQTKALSYGRMPCEPRQQNAHEHLDLDAAGVLCYTESEPLGSQETHDKDFIHLPREHLTQPDSEVYYEAHHKEDPNLFGMDSANLRNMHRICGEDYSGKMHLLMDYTGPPGGYCGPMVQRGIQHRVA